MPESKAPIITLTTDFGSRDHYVGSMKGAILAVNRDARIVDISHEIAPHRPLEGGFVLACAYAAFPPRTVHILVVDPGVGGPRRPLLVVTESHYFLAPDNGCLAFVFEREPVRTVYEITAAHYFRQEVSGTFHGRDVFAPVAGWLTRGTGVESFGSPVEDYAVGEVPRPKLTREGQVRLTVLHVDRFGNVITNLQKRTLDDLLAKNPGKTIRMEIGGQALSGIVTHYAEGPDGAPFALIGSAGHLEIALKEASAAETLGLTPGQQILMSLV